MTATAAEALELALWLHRAPSRRAALLGRPLPDGIGQLLRVAGGAADQVAAAAKITGEDEATILEAVRFYLQQILFHDEADAYRVLGLRPNAPQDQAREHHRLLQQWLHPDRRGSDDWETVYATRINRAWSHLRTPQARAAYDATCGTPYGGEQKRDFKDGRRQGGEYQVAPRGGVTGAIQQPRDRIKSLTLLVLLGCVGLLVLIALRQERPPKWQDLSPSLAEATTVPESESEPADIAPIVATLGAALVDKVNAAPKATSEPETLSPIATAPATGRSPAMVLAEVGTRPMNSLRPTAPPATSPAAPSAVPEPQPLPVSVEVEVQPGPPTPAMTPSVGTLALAVSEPAAPLPPVTLPLSIPNALDRMTQARERAHQVSAYLGDLTAAAPPVWNDVDTLRKAQKLRAELHQRLGMPRQADMEWLEPKWRLNADGAWLEAGYRVATEQGRLDIGFGWREDQLLIRSIDLVPGT